MHYTIVDRNLLIPEVIVKSEFFEGLEELYKKTFLRDEKYNRNVYMIKYSGVRFEGYFQSDGKNIYETLDGNKRQLEIDYSYLYISNQQNVQEQINNQTTFTKSTNNNEILKQNLKEKTEPQIKNIKIICNDENDENDENKDMQLKIMSKNDTNIKIDITDGDRLIVSNSEEEKINLEKEKKKEELLKMCEQVMDMYNLELNKIKKTELNLITLDNKIDKLMKKKREQIFNNITRTKNEFETWKKIKYGIPVDKQELVKLPESELEALEEPIIPILFAAKYNYIEKIMENSQVKELFGVLNQLELADLYVKDEIDLSPQVIKFVEKYTEISKKDLHYKFDHDWDYLDSEFDQVEANSLFKKSPDGN